MRKFTAIVCIVIMLCTILVSCNDSGVPSALPTPDPAPTPTPPTNEEMIEDCIYAFMTAYNDGDLDGTLTCLTKENRVEIQALLTILGAFTEGMTGVSIDLKEIFSFGVAAEAGDYIKLNIQKIEIENSLSAVATATMDLASEGEETIYFIMAYETGGWYIEDMTEENPNPVSINPNEPQAND